MSELRSDIGKPRPEKSAPDTWGWDDRDTVDPVIERTTAVIGGERVYFTLHGGKGKFFDVEFRVELQGEDPRSAVDRLGDIARATLSDLLANPGTAHLDANVIRNAAGGSHIAVTRSFPKEWIGQRATFMLYAQEIVT